MSSDPIAARAAWMGLLSRAEPAALAAAFARLGPEPAHEELRTPETGLAMARGRIGATGDAFNLGETTVTRCVLRLSDGATGIAYALGRDKAHARRAALCDALLQGARAEAVRREVLAPLEAAETARRTRIAAKAAATRVDFFTLVRGEDA